MLRSSLFTASAFALAASAAAQTPTETLTPELVPGVVKNAGTYHVATGTWTRANNSVASFGINDNIYSNTSQSGYFSTGIGPTGTRAGGIAVDSGEIPGTTNPTVFAQGGATVDISTVFEFQFGYCDLDPNAGVAGWTFDFYEDYAPCTLPVTVPVQTIVLTGFPSNGCWALNVDLSAATGTSQEFLIQADGGAAAPGFDGIEATDSFGVSWQYTGTGLAQAGPLITGDPVSTDTGFLTGQPNTGSNTYFGEIGGCPGTGSGFGVDDLFYIEDAAGGAAACGFFGGYVNNASNCGPNPGVRYAAFWMEISANLTGGPTGPTPISQPGCVGAVTITGAPAVCEVFGDPIAANNDVEIRASLMPANEFGIFATGLATVPPNTVNSGNGFICINPSVMGGLGRFAMANQIKSSGANGTFSLETSLGEWDNTVIPTSTGTYAAMAGTTSNFQGWFREQVGAGFNFTGSCSLTWQ